MSNLKVFLNKLNQTYIHQEQVKDKKYVLEVQILTKKDHKIVFKLIVFDHFHLYWIHHSLHVKVMNFVK